MPIVDIDDARLDYTEAGSGEPLVLVHGSASDRRTWEHQRDEFAQRFRVISYSRRYHWPNAPIADGVDYAMLQHVDDLQALLRRLNAAPAHLVGHSYGAFLCLLLALREPALVRTLVLAEPPALTLYVSSVPTPVEIIKLLVTRPRTAAAVVKFGATGVAPATRAFRRGDTNAGVRAFGDAVFGRGGFDRFPESRKRQVRDNLSNVKAEVLGSGFAPLPAQGVGRLRCPTLLVTGARSVPLFGRLADGLQEVMPHAERVQIPGASHAMHEDNAPAYNAAVTEFLARHRESATA